MLKKIFLWIAFISITPALQAQTATINIKGVVLDESTGRPLGKELDIDVVGKTNGKKYKVKVNSSSGEYLQPIPSGDVYTLTFNSYAVFRKTEILDLPATPKFREERHDYKVRSIVEGNSIASVNAFDPGQSQVTATGREQLLPALDILKQNRELNIVVNITPDDNPPPPPPKQRKAVKKTKGKKAQMETEPEETQQSAPQFSAETLYQERVAELKRFFSDAKNAEIRVRYEMDPMQHTTPGLRNVKITVGPVKSILDD